MQLIEALRESCPVMRPGLSVVHPVLPSPIIPGIMIDKPLPAKVGRASALHAATRQDPIPVIPAPLPGCTATQRPGCGMAPTTKSQTVTPAKMIRPRSASVSRNVSKSCSFVEQDIPLYLVPAIVARVIWQRGEQTFRISVIRTQQHYYTIRLRTARPKTGKGTRHCAKSCRGKKEHAARQKMDSRLLPSMPSEFLNP